MDASSEDLSARCQQINERFYAADPADYLRTRLLTLLGLAGNPVAFVHVLSEGVEYAGVRVQGGEPSEVDVEDLKRYVTIESQLLLHHSAEVLVRLFLAHAEPVPCPWIVVSGEKGPFKEKVRRTLVDPHISDLDRSVGHVILGRTEPDPGGDAAEWQQAVRNAAAFLQDLAARWLRDSQLYNSMKHGLAASAGDAIFQLLPDDGAPVRLGEGASVDYLKASPWTNGRREWHLTTAWVDVAASLALVQIATQMIASLWVVARHRYVGGPAEGNIFYPANLKPADLRGPTRSAVRTVSWSMVEEVRSKV